MQGMSLNLALIHKENTYALQPVKINVKAPAIDMRVIFHINDILNDS